MKTKVMPLSELKETIKMYFKRQEKRQDGQISATEDLDEFDRILLQLSMHFMIGQVDQSMIPHFDQI